LKGLNGILS
jgi:hypothetical protein